MNYYPSNWFTQIQPGNILRIQAIKNYCKIYFINNQSALVLSITLLRVQERLPSEMFVRVHRSHIVNRIHVKKMKMEPAVQMRREPAMQVELTNGEHVPISRRKAASVKKPFFIDLLSRDCTMA